MKSVKMFVATVLLAAVVCHADGLLVKKGEKIAFMGDSITQFGAGVPGGYIHLVIDGFKANGIDVSAIPAGISGHESDEMLARVKKDVIDKHSDWMTLSCGVNDVWHGCGVNNGGGVSLEDYKKNISSLVDQCQAAGIKVMILTSTMIGEDPSDKRNVALAPYNDFLRSLAKDRGLPLADLNREMAREVEQAVKAGVKGNALTCDGVHMAPLGNVMMAAGILETFGVTPDGIAKARTAWKDISAACWGIRLTLPKSVTMGQYQALVSIATQQGKSVNALLEEACAEGVKRMLSGKE